MPHGLDTDREVFFYEQEFYVLSNFSSFNLVWDGQTFPTSEHAYHWAKFFKNGQVGDKDHFEAMVAVRTAPSAHEAFKLAQKYFYLVRPDWHDVRLNIMKEILRAKVAQHPYVKKKLLETGDRVIIENSWRDDFWGWGENKTGQNMLGKLWMEIRNEIRGG